MSNFTNTILKLGKSLFPTGRAFKAPKFGVLDLKYNAIALAFNRAYCDALSILNSVLPDNDNFTEEDALNWERRLGLITNELIPLEDRKLAIKRKMNHPGTIKARGHYLYLENQLQAAGFNVKVYENKFDIGGGNYEAKSPLEIEPTFPIFIPQYGQKAYGQVQYGQAIFQNIIANHIEIERDRNFIIGDNFRSTFFISGETLENFGSIPIEREKEFRKLVLNIKPVQTVAFLFINYTS